ncbi:MAG: PAS domain S-box protein [Burkholderiaceae bacterium]|nr:PAS domain S-box protein [Burkholderiaceae bacterium]
MTTAPRSPPAAPPARRPAVGLQRLLGRWWRRQSPSRQDRFVTVAPLVSVLLFLAAIISAFWYLRNEEFEREAESVKRDVEVIQQQLGLRLIQNQEQLVRLAGGLSARPISGEALLPVIETFARDRPEITHMAWYDVRRRPLSIHWAPLHHGALPPDEESSRASRPIEGAPSAAEGAFRTARQRLQPTYSTIFADSTGAPVFQLHVPLVDGSAFAGALVVEYAVDALLRYEVPADVSARHRISIVDLAGRTHASTVTAMPGAATRPATIVQDLPLVPALNGLLLRAEGYRTSIGLIGNTLFWMVVALSVLTVWMLLGSWRHMRRRAQIQRELVQETNFRRAMENSMPTGMRAMDLEGRISYVNAAFCNMVGFGETELIGRTPPFPYWPPDRIEENTRLLQQELQGRSPAGGIEVRVMRKDGTQFDARMYISPLVDPKGQQAGWMTSVTNITEAKRIRDQLSASHERFTTVLEGLDASVSVLSVQQRELLFVNRSYRLWFGSDPRGHATLAGGMAEDEPPTSDDYDELSGLPTQELTEAGIHPREVFVEPLQKWFDVRARYLQWTDGRLAQMIIATDITARVRAEEIADAQAEKAQVTSRLVTMGEMASSVAHELNQPLTAITNYCNGMVSRVQAGSIGTDDLIAALQKTSKQAQRAGQIIHRIRAFVKRSEPQRQAAQATKMVEDAVELANIELRRRNVAIRVYVAQRLPVLMVDPILIEQVLLNLLKNAAEAIDGAHMPPARRHIELRVVPRHTPDEGGVIEFSVTDQGPGLPPEVSQRLYEAFFSTKPEGLGIGLGLCRTIVESHRGRMRAENLYNGDQVAGCRFSFTLPVELAARAADAADAGVASNPTVTP